MSNYELNFRDNENFTPLDQVHTYGLPEKVIVFHNDTDKEMWVGTLVGFVKIAGTMLPVVHDPEEEKDYMVMGMLWPYDEKLWAFVSSLENVECWDLVTRIVRLQSELKRIQQREETICHVHVMKRTVP
jgi:hypothetical protein